MKGTELNQDIKRVLEEISTKQTRAVESWHRQEGKLRPVDGLSPLERLPLLAENNHLVNFRLWHVEDQARRTDAPDSLIADCKRRIDGLNQERNDFMEAMDQALVELYEPMSSPEAGLNTETMGSVLDRLSILALKIFHMAEQAHRQDADKAHRDRCAAKLATLEIQRRDLAQSLLDLADEYAAGTRRPRIYRQFKMYNDPELNPELYGNK